ncbi:protein NRT1/ PTR FAMILY 5.10-like isoform X1 [Andrographis paniculata]|uniref:protein NRT1/ PTR FAMILY 5.10-like isoform X1 n=1 Tax=Andrographis paniculata TaxID=175694 RepID=UPI0021E94DE5|nr:protein NRT1/ PTR FAMILY 5.10-like isoform X1 [Andrographis paniculata]
MAVSGDGEVDAETPFLDDVVRGCVNFNGLPSERSKSGSWKSASFIIGVEVAERFAYYGISMNLISYLTGPLGQSMATAAENVNVWNGASTLLPLLGAFVADSFLGRYRTIIIASLLYVLGLGCLTLSAAFHSSNTSRCNGVDSECSPPFPEVFVFFSSLYLVAFAQGGHKPCVQAFGADQFDENDRIECKAKSSFFNWWYFSMNGGILAATLILIYIQENLSWELGFGIPCIFMCFALFTFLLGSKSYRFRINNDERNPFVRIGSVFVKAARNWKAPSQPHVGTKFEFLDKALVAPDGSYKETNECSIQDVEDAKVLLRFVPIWLCCLGYALVYSQGSTLFTKQGSTMERYITPGFQIPAASLQAFICLSIVILAPIYDLVLVPIARAVTKKAAGISMLQRIGTGIFFGFLSMVAAALIEKRRLATAVKYGIVDEPMETVPMSIWWLVPQYVLMGIADLFTMVGLQEFFYDQIPNELKSIGLALYLSIFGAGSFLSSFLISVIEKATGGDGRDSWFSDNLNRAHLDYFYWLLAGLSAPTMAAFAYFASTYVYNKKEIVGVSEVWVLRW